MAAFQPLNPLLYERLVELFGEVKPSNPGEAYLATEEDETLSPGAASASLFGHRPRDSLSAAPPRPGRRRVTQRRGEYYFVNCPLCGDTRHRLGISYQWDRDPGLCWCYNETACMARHDNRQYLRMVVLGTHRTVELPLLPAKAVSAVLEEVPPPGAVTPLPALSLTHPVRRYVEQRGFDPHWLWQHYRVGLVQRVDDPRHRPLAGRLYIPFFQGGKLRAWQGRWPEDRPKEWWKLDGAPPKYYNLPGMPAGQLLYGWDASQGQGDVVLVEGAFDVWGVGRQGLGVIKCRLSPAQRELLVGGRPGAAVAVAMDGEAWAETQRIVDQLRPYYGPRAFAVPLPPGRDPGELDPEWTWAPVLSAAARQGVPFRRQA